MIFAPNVQKAGAIADEQTFKACKNYYRFTSSHAEIITRKSCISIPDDQTCKLAKIQLNFKV